MTRLPCLILADRDVLARVDGEDIVRLTAAATEATFYRDDLTADQIAANRRVVEISGPTAVAAAASSSQYLAGAFVADRFAGYVISTRHSPGDHELDWLMVHPDFHGQGVAAVLMEAGMGWLGLDRAMWLNVIRFNTRAIAFYRRFGFEIDSDTRIEKAVPNWIMRRPGRG
jgi:ribosomal protein S18 acetylase RimI-like enzyme